MKGDKISNKFTYAFITFSILILLVIGVNAYASGGPASAIGHSAEELEGVCLSDGTNCASSGGLWTLSGANIYRNSGIVSVGTSTPVTSSKLNVQQTSTSIFDSAIYALSTDKAIGIYGRSNQGYGIYGESGTNFAGYFAGSVQATKDICTTISGSQQCLSSVGGK